MLQNLAVIMDDEGILLDWEIVSVEDEFSIDNSLIANQEVEQKQPTKQGKFIRNALNTFNILLTKRVEI